MNHKPNSVAVFLFVTLAVVVKLTNGNLCALCQSLRERLPNEFHSCVLRNFVIRHCDENIDTHLSVLKIIGVKRVVKVNYGKSGGVEEFAEHGLFWEIGVEVVADYDHHHSNNGHHRSSLTSQSSNTTSRHVPSSPPLAPPAHVQLAVIRFTKYPSSLLMQNPCRHVLGTSNSLFGKRRNLPTNNGQRISTLYFAIDDKVCHGGSASGGGRGKRKKCIPNPSNLTHPYVCCPQHPVQQNTQQQCYRNETRSNSWQHSSSPPRPPEEESILRPLVLSIQSVCICFTCILSLSIFWIRKTKAIQVSIWPLTESIIFGSMLLYMTVALRASYDFDTISDFPWWTYSQEPHSQAWACVAEPWAREVGFTLVYGGIILKIYRSLVEFRTRKAHRWVVREKDILRYLGTTVGVVLFYLLAWTCTTQMVGRGEEEWHVEGYGIVSEVSNDNEIVCPAVTPWHRVTEIGELLYITVGLNMAWHLRTSPVSPFLERQMYTAALMLEATTSVLLIMIRESKLMFFSEHGGGHGHEDEEEENATFLLVVYFIRCHVTTTIVLALVLGPKLYYVYLDASTRKRAQLRRNDTLSGTTGGGSTTGPTAAASLSNLANLKLGGGGGIVGIDHHTLIDLDFAEVSLADMDPQDIKSELKRVYTQLELLRNKTMRKDNPHISKRRGGRKPTHRRFSLQKKGSRDKTAAAAAAMRSRMQAQQAQQSGELYTNNRYSSRYNDDIEDSVCSIEGPSTYSEVGGYR